MDCVNYVCMIRYLTAAAILVMISSFAPRAYLNGVAEQLTKQQYEKMFPHRAALYSYENFIAATKSYPQFAAQASG